MLDRDLETITEVGRHGDGYPIGEPDRLRVGDPIRSREQNLITGIEESGPKQTLLKGVVDACREMGVKIVAEGIETSEQFEKLRELGVPYGQGYFVGRATRFDPGEG